MALFEDINDIKNTFDEYIDIWVEVNGRKKNTYAINWNISDGQLKEHLRTIKRKNGCNGTIKEVINGTASTKAMQLQGDHAQYLRQYMVTNGVDASLIRIKG
jgi:translation initiation factor 1 (eIF-1/SUI1)